jgi:hypothetical protein
MKASAASTPAIARSTGTSFSTRLQGFREPRVPRACLFGYSTWTLGIQQESSAGPVDLL